MTDAGATDARTLPARVGIWGVLALLVGNAVSIPIFVLPGPLAADAGPSVVLAVVLAAIPAAFVVLYNAVLASAMPVAGGLYVYISRLTSPFWGFLVPFTIPLIAWAGLVFTAIGFAEYSRIFVDLPQTALAIVLLAFVLAVNVVGVRIVAQIQVVFVAGLALAVGGFVGTGAVAVDPTNYTGPFVADYGAFGVAVVSLFYPFLGFGLLVELGEDIEEPSRTIPRVLGIGIAIVAACYVAVVAVLVGLVPIGELAAMTEAEQNAALAVAAAAALPGWGHYLVGLGALCAVVTTVNTTLLVTSRTLMRASRDGVLPASLSRIHPRFDTPHVAVLVLGLPPFALVLVLGNVVALAMFMALASLTAYFFCAIGLWNLPREFPDHYRTAPFRLRRRRGLPAAVLGGAVATGLFWIVTLTQEPLAGLVLLGWFAVGYGYYRYRLTQTDRIELYRRMTALDEHERVDPAPDDVGPGEHSEVRSDDRTGVVDRDGRPSDHDD